MNDKELCELFGTTLEDVERDVAKIEAGDFSDFNFSKVIDGRLMEKEKMDMISAPVAHSRVMAIKRVTEQQGISRAEFLRRAIDNELMAQD